MKDEKDKFLIVSMYLQFTAHGLTSHWTHNRTFWRRDFPDNQMHQILTTRLTTTRSKKNTSEKLTYHKLTLVKKNTHTKSNKLVLLQW